jgi:hypothetical protein
MNLNKERGQPKIMTDKSDAFLCVRLTGHIKLQLHLPQQKLILLHDDLFTSCKMCSVDKQYNNDTSPFTK